MAIMKKEILKAYLFRLKPNNDQKSLLNQHIGSCRFIYNRSLAENIEKYSVEKKFIFKNEASKSLTLLKKEEEYKWLRQINSQSLQGAIAHLDIALQRFFKKISGFPTFHKKSHGGSFGIPQNVKVEDDKVFIPKFKEGIKFVKHREISSCGKKNMTLTLDIRTWACEHCGAKHNRDFNAALNIKNEGLRILKTQTL
jgi:putative transposase